MICKLCGGLLGFLGRLGSLDWFVCQDCGMQCNHPADSEIEVDDE